MLASCFEKYYAVSDEAATGILDGDVAATDSPAPVLHHAVLLAGKVTNSHYKSLRVATIYVLLLAQQRCTPCVHLPVSAMVAVFR